MSIIKVKNFSKSYGKTLAVNNVSFEVNKGDIVGFVGKNGAGKSTTIRAMLNMIFPTKGSITINGLDSVKNSKSIKKLLSYIPSEVNFHEKLKVKDIFEFYLKFENMDKSRLQSLVTYFEFDVNKRVKELSLGNSKKLAIILSLLKNKDIIIMDEPTSGLDPLMQKKFFELILKEKAKGVTIFLSSHNLSEIDRYCDRVLIIKDGIIVDDLNMEALKHSRKKTLNYICKNGSTGSIELNGDINQHIKFLSELDLEEISIIEPSAESSFISYYEEDKL
ncbi:MAG: ABC transporter ATP-binding protein [Christensenellaceae bacterium]|nr:ABC transporter ATP-binding protein [Christensenellaceae bacterium]